MGLTGGLAKTANYAGTTVETRNGRFETPGGASVTLIDLPGIYGLEARSTDERVAVEAIQGKRGEPPPDALILVADAANLRTHLHTVLQMKSLGLPVIVALNMIDLAERDGVKIDVPKLSAMLGVPVVATRATRKAGRESLIAKIDEVLKATAARHCCRRARSRSPRPPARSPPHRRRNHGRAGDEQVHARHGRVLLHPVAGVVVLVGRAVRGVPGRVRLGHARDGCDRGWLCGASGRRSPR
jgi:ferrous iron transport protein B